MTLTGFSRILLVTMSVAALALTPVMIAPALAQAAKPDAKKPAAKKPEAKKPDAKKPDAKKPADKKTEKKPEPAPAVGGAQPTLLGQFGDWGAYTASPGGKKVCFVIAKPTQTQPTGLNRDPTYMFISTRPADKVKDEVSVILGYPAKANVDATAEIGATHVTMYTQKDGAWVKNTADEAKMVAALRSGSDVVVKAESGRGTKITDTYSLKGLSQALDRVGQECK